MKVRTTIIGTAALATLAWAPAVEAKGTLYVVGGNSNAVAAHPIAADGSLGAGTNTPTVQTPRSVAITPDGRFLYTTGANGNNIGIHAVDTATGALGGLQGPVAAGDDPEGPSVTPNGQFLYVANTAGNSLSGYSIDQGTGGLTPLPGFPVALANANATAVSPDGTKLYATTDTGVQPYTIAADGSIAPNGGLVAGTNPRALAITPDGRFLYMANSNGNTVAGFAIAADGTLSPAGSPAPAGPTPFGLAITPAGQFAYTANFTDPGTANAYSIGADGTLAAVSGQPFPTGSQFPYAVDAAPNGRVYVANDVQGGAPGTVTAFNVAGDGALSAIGSPTTTVIAPEFQSVMASPNQGPTAAFTATPAANRQGGGGQSVAFNASGASDSDGGTVAAYTWDFGDGGAPETTSSPTISHTYANAGNYQVTLTVTDDEGCSSAVIFTGQTADCNGSAAARATQTVSIADDGPPVLKLKGRKQELSKRVVVKAKTSDDTDAVAKGSLTVAPRGGKSKRYKLKKFTAELEGGEKEKLKPKLSKKAYKKAKAVLKNKGKVTAKVKAKVTDADDDTDKDSVKVKLTKP